MLAWPLPRAEQVTRQMRVCLFVSLFLCLQVLLTDTKMLDKALIYTFLQHWLGEGLLTSTGMFV